MPMNQVTILDSWYVTGLQGTGSDTVIAENVFVPDHMIVMTGKLFDGTELREKHVGAPSDKLPVMAAGRMTNLAQLLGGAQQMLDLIEAEVTKKPLIGTTYKTKSDAAVVVHDIGRIAAQLDSAELLLFDAMKQFDDGAVAGKSWSNIELSRSKAQGAQIVGLIHRSIEEIMFLGGSSAFALANPLQRYWRDIHIALRHILHIPLIGYELYGRDRLDLKPNILPSGSY
jgi:alkylation response protein AidB-like acyl-CoA dehydrogenase